MEGTLNLVTLSLLIALKGTHHFCLFIIPCPRRRDICLALCVHPFFLTNKLTLFGYFELPKVLKMRFIPKKITGICWVLTLSWLVGFVALRPKSTAMVIAGRSVHLTTLFPGQA